MRVLLRELPLSAPRKSCFDSALLNAGACRTFDSEQIRLEKNNVGGRYCEEEAGEAQEISEQGLVAASASGCLCSDVTEFRAGVVGEDCGRDAGPCRDPDCLCYFRRTRDHEL
jgi:hypothetical protein